MGKGDKDECIRLAEKADGKGGRAASSKVAGDPPAAMVQPGLSGDCAFGGPWPFPGQKPPDYRHARTHRNEDSKPSMHDFAKRVIVEFCCGKDSLIGGKDHQRTDAK